MYVILDVYLCSFVSAREHACVLLATEISVYHCVCMGGLLCVSPIEKWGCKTGFLYSINGP